jgi:hypothetical protein
MKNMIKMLVREATEERPLGILRCRWEYNITTNLKGTGWESAD